MADDRYHRVPSNHTAHVISLGLVLGGVCLAGAAAYQGRSSRAEGNVALGKPYRLIPPPSYKLCTDADDRIQLTDGVKGDSNWRQLRTVGWRDPPAPPTVLIDLGTVEPIEEIRISSVGGGRAGVFFPAQILVMVSDDGETFRVAAALNRPKVELDDPDRFRRIPHVFRLEGLRTRGRFVRVTLVPNRRYVFMDEIEVLRGSHAAGEVEFDDRNMLTEANAPTVLATVRQFDRLHGEIARFGEAVRATGSDPTLRQAAATLRVALIATPAYLPAPVESLGARLRSTRGEWLGQQRRKALVWHQANPMEQVRPGDVFDPPARADEELEIELWQGEYESAAVTVINCTPRDLKLSVAVSPLRSASGSTRPSTDALTLRRVVFVEAPNLGIVGDALVKLADTRLPIDAGGAGQLWLTVHNPDLGAGDYRFAVRLDAAADGPGEKPSLVVPGRLTVHPCRFPERVSLNTYNWAYLTRLGLSEEDLAETVRDLEDHYTNVHVIPGTELPQASLKGNGPINVDFTRHDQALAQFPDAERYLFWWGYAPGRLDRHKVFGRWMSPSWKAGMRQYLTRWVAHLRATGINYDRFAMYPFDESLGDEFHELAKFIKKVDPRIPLFANSPGRGREKGIGRFLPYVDTWCLPEPLPRSHQARAKLRKSGNKEIWRYNATGNAKSLSPYEFYRLQPWRAWSEGDTGCGFWVYATGRSGQSCNGWDDYTCGRGRWSVVYDGWDAPVDGGGEVYIPSRRWEAWREGVEDYEYLHTLHGRIEAARRRNLPVSMVEEAEAVLGQAVTEILTNRHEANVVYAVRRRITEAILRLDRATGAKDHAG